MHLIHDRGLNNHLEGIHDTKNLSQNLNVNLIESLNESHVNNHRVESDHRAESDHRVQDSDCLQEDSTIEVQRFVELTATATARLSLVRVALHAESCSISDEHLI
jgi:hypothetical protein